MATNASLNTPYLLLGGTLVIGLVFVFMVLQPMMEEIGRAQDTITEQTNRLNERQEFLSTIDRKLAVLQTQLPHEERLAVLLPVDERAEDALRIIDQAAAVSGVVVQRVSNTSSQSQGQVNAQRARGEVVDIPVDVGTLTFSVDFSGTYQQVRSLLKEFERAPRLMDVIDVQLARNENAPDQVTGGLIVQFYVQQPPSTNEL